VPVGAGAAEPAARDAAVEGESAAIAADAVHRGHRVTGRGEGVHESQEHGRAVRVPGDQRVRINLRQITAARPELQTIISSHASDIISACKPEELVVLRRLQDGRRVSRVLATMPINDKKRTLRTARLHLDATRSSALFAECMIITEDVTEGAILRQFGRTWAGSDDLKRRFIESLTVTVMGCRPGRAGRPSGSARTRDCSAHRHIHRHRQTTSRGLHRAQVARRPRRGPPEGRAGAGRVWWSAVWRSPVWAWGRSDGGQGRPGGSRLASVTRLRRGLAAGRRRLRASARRSGCSAGRRG
jgi:hypothetical protein